MRSILGFILAACVGLAVAVALVPNVKVEGNATQVIKIILLAGIVLGLFNFFLKPLINLITFPLRWLTFGLIGLVINMLMVWLIDVIFTPELTIKGLWPLFWTALLVWGANLIFARKSFGAKRPEVLEQ